MTDIHAHVLHNFDDGPADLEGSLKLLADCEKKGVSRIVCSSHYYSSRMPPETFLAKRKRRLDELTRAMEENNIHVELIKGAEVNISEILLNQDDISHFCIGNTRNMLFEIPSTENSFQRVEELIERISSYFNVKPIIVHIERYKYLSAHPENLMKLKMRGCKIQIDAQVLTEHSLFLKGKILNYIKEGLVDFVASDCHGDKRRVQNLPDAYRIIEQKLGTEYAKVLDKNAKSICFN